jgi:hypothetical protein
MADQRRRKTRNEFSIQGEKKGEEEKIVGI